MRAIIGIKRGQDPTQGGNAMKANCNHDDILATYRSTESIRETARKHNVSPQTVRRILITNGVHLGDHTQTEQIIAMLAEMSVEEVAAKLKRSVKTIKAYQPYTKGSYAVGE